MKLVLRYEQQACSCRQELCDHEEQGSMTSALQGSDLLKHIPPSVQIQRRLY